MNDFVSSRRDNLRSRPSDCVIQTRCDTRTIATIARYFQAKGLIPQSHAQLIRLALEELRVILIHNSLVEDVETTHAAMELLEGLGIGGFNPGARGTKNLHDSLVRDNLLVPENITKESINLAMKKLMEDGTVKDIRLQAEKGGNDA